MIDTESRLVESFFDWLRLERGRAANTIAAYRRDVAIYRDWLTEAHLDLETVTPTELEQYVHFLMGSGRSPASVARAVTTVRSLYRYGAAEGLLGADPAARLEPTALPAALPKALSEAEVERLLASPSTEDPIGLRDRAMLEVLYGVGLRASELVGLSMSRVDLDGRLLRVMGKGSKERIVPLGRIAAMALAEWFDNGRPIFVPTQRKRRDDSDAVFLNSTGSRMSRQAVWLVVERHAKRAGLDAAVSPHVLRHSCATHMLDHGADIRSVQELLGHASISTTQIYTKVSSERLRQAYYDAHPRARRKAPPSASASAPVEPTDRTSAVEPGGDR
jgi:tyrosine recombinase XerD